MSVFKQKVVTVATGGTPVRAEAPLSTAGSGINEDCYSAIHFQSPLGADANTDTVYIGISASMARATGVDVVFTLQPGERAVITHPGGANLLPLSAFWCDVDVNGESVYVTGVAT